MEESRKQPVRLDGKTILVTGSPGFIGAALVMRLLRELRSGTVVSFDSMNDYYDTALKEYRLRQIEALAAASAAGPDPGGDSSSGLSGGSGSGLSGGSGSGLSGGSGPRHVFVRGDLTDQAKLEELFSVWHPDVVVHLAAQAGVRCSIDHPEAYIGSNLVGFFNVLEACRHAAEQGHPVEHLVFASSSSVYGGNKKIPFSTEDPTDSPVSLYAATKKSGELLAHSYAKLYSIPTTGLRFFTVYGPAGRPDMFYYIAAERLASGGIIRLFNHGDMKRDFTYIDDIVTGVLRVMQGAPEQRTGEDGLPVPPFAVYNIGGGRPENLLDFVTVLQEELVRAGVLPADYDFAAHRELAPMQPGDVPLTFADTTALERDYGFRPSVGIREGLRKFAEWYRDYSSTQWGSPPLS